MDDFFFVGLPYISFVLFFGGLTYRAFSGFKSAYRTWDLTVRGDFLWTTRSTGFFGRASLGPATLCLHWGLILLILAHIIGFIGGGFGFVLLVDIFRWIGRIGGILLFYGAIWAFIRRIVNPQVRITSTAEDYIVLLFLILISGTGLLQDIIRLIFGISYSVAPWLASIFKLQPSAELMRGIPLLSKIHVVINLLFFAYFPFTKLVHMITFPIAYATRPYISMRRYAGLKR